MASQVAGRPAGGLTLSMSHQLIILHAVCIPGLVQADTFSEFVEVMKDSEGRLAIIVLAAVIVVAILISVAFAILLRRLRIQMAANRRPPAKQYSSFNLGKHPTNTSSYSQVGADQVASDSQGELICTSQALQETIAEEEQSSPNPLLPHQGLIFRANNGAAGASVEATSNLGQFANSQVSYGEIQGGFAAQSVAVDGGGGGQSVASNQRFFMKAVSLEEREVTQQYDNVYLRSDSRESIASEDLHQYDQVAAASRRPAPRISSVNLDMLISVVDNTYDSVH